MSRGDNVQGFWVQSVHFGQNGGWDESCKTQVFLYVIIHATFQQLRNGQFSPNLVTKCTSVSRRGMHKDIFENFHLPPKSKIKSQSNKHLTQSRLQVTGCTAEREIMCTPHCSPRAREFPISVNFSLQGTVAELRGVSICSLTHSLLRLTR